jgi:uncharacterized protein YgiM (DUF1202 family)
MKRRAVMVGAVLIVAAGAATAQTNTKWVERTKADVRAGKGSFHDIVDTVLKGEQVQVLQSDDKWLSVKTPRGKTGWMFEKALSASAVAPGQSDFLKMVPGGDASTSATAASTGAKGIYAEQYARAKGYDYGTVTWIEQSQPGAPEMAAFAKSGSGK